MLDQSSFDPYLLDERLDSVVEARWAESRAELDTFAASPAPADRKHQPLDRPRFCLGSREFRLLPVVLLAELRKIERLAATPVMVVSALAGTPSHLLSGVVGLAKPPTSNRLVALIEKVSPTMSI